MPKPNDYASGVSWHINAPAPVGNHRLRAVESYEEGKEGSTETRTEVGPSKDASGFVHIPGGRTISFDIRETKGKREVDWEYLDDNEIAFELTKEIVGGQSVQYTPVKVSTISYTGDSGNEHTYTVECVALGRKPL